MCHRKLVNSAIGPQSGVVHAKLRASCAKKGEAKQAKETEPVERNQLRYD